jgi:phosphatidylethanolamine-binding protein (PEBP) family uncharacterized protein
MRSRPRPIPGVVLLSALALAGCGSSAATTSSTPQKIAFHSSAVSNNTMPATYTCDGRNTWPPLEWGKIPPGTGSLALFVVGIIPKPATHTFKVSVEWAVAGLLPTLHKLEPGHLPSYAYVGINSRGKQNYSICPEKGVAEQYQFELYGVPLAYGVASSHFSAVQLISALASPTSSSHASAYGAFIAKYTRK